MAKISNPRKQFQFNIIIPGLNPFLAQKVKSPDVEFDITEHGDTNFVVKTAGLKKIGQVTIEKIFSATSIDNFIGAWQKIIGNQKTGSGLIPDVYKKSIIIQQLGPDRITVLQSWVCEGCWPQKRNGIDFDRKGSENTIESIEFCVDEVEDF